MDATEYFHSMALLSLVVDWAILVARKSVLHGKVGTKTLYSLALDLVMALFGPTGHIYVTMVMHLLGQLGVEHGWLAMQGDAYVAGEDLCAAGRGGTRTHGLEPQSWLVASPALADSHQSRTTRTSRVGCSLHTVLFRGCVLWLLLADHGTSHVSL